MPYMLWGVITCPALDTCFWHNYTRIQRPRRAQHFSSVFPVSPIIFLRFFMRTGGLKWIVYPRISADTRVTLIISWMLTMKLASVHHSTLTFGSQFTTLLLQASFPDLQSACVAINSLWPSDAIWRHRFGSILALIMACCLMAPSHYLNHCWLLISEA